MDSTVLLIAAGGSLLFFGALIYKALWFIRKVRDAPEGDDSAGGKPT